MIPLTKKHRIQGSITMMINENTYPPTLHAVNMARLMRGQETVTEIQVAIARPYLDRLDQFCEDIINSKHDTLSDFVTHTPGTFEKSVGYALARVAFQFIMDSQEIAETADNTIEAEIITRKESQDEKITGYDLTPVYHNQYAGIPTINS